MKINKIIICLLIMLMIFSLASCGNKTVDNIENTDTAKSKDDEGGYSGTWVTDGGMSIMLEPDIKEYILRTSFKRIGCGNYYYTNGAWKVKFGGNEYKVKKISSNKIKLIALEEKGPLSDVILKKDDTVTLSNYSVSELQGEWQNKEGTIFSYDMTNKKCTIYELLHKGTDVDSDDENSDDADVDVFYKYSTVKLKNDFDGRGNYITINSKNVCLTINDDQTIGFYFMKDQDEEEKEIFDGKFSRISYVLNDDINLTSNKEKYIKENAEENTEDLSIIFETDGSTEKKSTETNTSEDNTSEADLAVSIEEQ